MLNRVVAPKVASSTLLLVDDRKGVGPALHRLGTACGRGSCPDRGHPPRESTSGKANCDPLRGGARDATLRVRAFAKAGACAPGEFVAGTSNSLVPDGTGLSSRAVTSLRQRVFEFDRVGAKLSSRAIAARNAMLGSRRATRPLAREFSVGQASQGAEPLATKSCARGRPRARCARFGRSHGRARRSHWLQNSMSGVWPIGPRGEEPPDHSKGLAHPRESADERKSVGSRLDGGKAARTVAGSRIA